MRERKKGNSSKMTERRGNVYENKGPLGKFWKKTGMSQKKNTFRFNPVMLLKVNELYHAIASSSSRAPH